MKTIGFSSTEELTRLLNLYSDNSNIIFKNICSNFTPLNEYSEYFDSDKDFTPYTQS